MPSFGKSSTHRLLTCHPDLQALFNAIILDFDCTIICGHRNQTKQDLAYKGKVSKVRWPDSRHNSLPSLAVDAAPYPIDWKDHRRFYMFCGIVRAYAVRMKSAGAIQYDIRCGADWDGDFEIKDQNFHDLPHFELVIK